MCNTFLVKIFCSIAQKNSLKEYFHKRRPGVLLLLLKKKKKTKPRCSPEEPKSFRAHRFYYHETHKQRDM